MKVKRSDDLTLALDRLRQNRIEEDTRKADSRDFFRGSEVGSCSNQINYRRRGVEVKEIGVDKARFLDDGHLHQATITAELRKAGIEVTGEEEESLETIIVGKKQVEITIKAHKDGTVRIDDEEYLLEVKSVKEMKFKDIIKTHDVAPYYDQIQVYLWLYGYRACKLLVINRNTSQQLEYTIQRDKERIKFLLTKLAKVEMDISRKETSTRDYLRTSRECGWCPYFKRCWEEDV